MFKDDIIKTYEKLYTFDYDESDDETYCQIRVIENNKTGAVLDSTIIEIEDESMHIYNEFLYEESDSLFEESLMNTEELLFIQNLFNCYKDRPQLNYWDGMGCPFEADQVGYFNLSLDLKLISEILTAFELALMSNEYDEINKDFFDENYPSLLDCYKNYGAKILDLLQEGLGDGFIPAYKMPSFREKNILFNKEDPIYINSERTIIAGATQEAYRKITQLLNISTTPLDEIYFGLSHFLGKVGEDIICVDIKLLNIIQSFIENYNYESDITYKADKSKLLHIETNGFWAFIYLMRIDKDDAIMREIVRIRNLSDSLKKIAPQNLLHYSFDFSKLDASFFEKMCRDLLNDMGFKNVVIRGSTNTSDGGVDIEGDEEVQSILGLETRHWIFQCKHTKTTIGRKDISEIPDLLNEFNADGYGIFYSGVFSPQTLDRMKNKNFRIAYWGKNELEHLLSKYNRTANKYFGI